jgi:hypothetical protein
MAWHSHRQKVSHRLRKSQTTPEGGTESHGTRWVGQLGADEKHDTVAIAGLSANTRKPGFCNMKTHDLA